MFAPPLVRLTAQAPLSTSRPATLQRKSTLKRSRDENGLPDPPSSPSKRSRVGFDSETEIFSADEIEELDPIVVREEVRRAIQRHQMGEEGAFTRIQRIFATPKAGENGPSNQAVRIYLQALLANVSLLNKSCNTLVNTVLLSEWVGRGDSFIQLYTKFLGNLAASQGGYLSKILQMLVDLLGLQKTRRLPDCRPTRQPRIHRRVLQTLRYITQLIPVASGSLAEAIKRRLSFDFAKHEERITFIKSFKDLIDFVPEIATDILDTICNELVKLDVSIQAEMDDDEDAEEVIMRHISSSQTLVAAASQQLPGTPLRSDEEDYDSTSPESDIEEEDLPEDELSRRKIKADVKQIDLIMDMLFQYFSRQAAKSSTTTMNQLLSQFHNIILPTYRSRHTQFLIFHFAQTSPIFVDQFVTSCIELLLDPHQSQYAHHAAAAYFSGFVGRGVHVSPTVVTDCIELLCDQLTSLRTQHEPLCRGPNLKRYADFYATFQAILYIFCFRWRDLASSDDSDNDDDFADDNAPESFYFSDKLRSALTAAVYSPLNPLRVCTPVIVEQFAKLAQALDFMFLHSKIASNRHVRLHALHERSISQLDINAPAGMSDGGLMGDNGVMEGYFPYDPYELPISRHWVEQEYVVWKGIPGEKIVEGSDEEEDEEEGVMVGVDGEEEGDSEEDGL
jgi:RNA polymerase I-specific transcription initiation factor RRN3